MKFWRDWFPDLLPHVPGCPNVLAQHELLRAAQVFLEKTRAWRMLLPAVSVTAKALETQILAGDAALELVRIESAYLDKKRLDPVTLETVEDRANNDWTQHTGTPDCCFQIRPGFLALYPVPAEDYTHGLTVRAAVRPSDSAIGLPDDIALRFWDQIHTGAKSRLMLIPGKSWTNTDMGGLYGRIFSDMVDKANADAAKAFGKARILENVKWC